ncbi:TRAP transporter small permease [Megalodesulfovibrio paquesii]
MSELLLALLCLAVAAILCLQAVCRYAFNHSLPWPDELAQVLLVWLTFLGGAVAWRRGAHLGIDIFMDWASERIGPGPAVLAQGICLAVGMLFFAVLLYQGSLLCGMLWPQQYPSLGVSKVISYAAIPVCAGLLLLHSLAHSLARLLASRQAPSERQ